MLFFNIPVEFTRDAEYSNSKPIARATWLNVVCYCCEQEHNGRIVDAMTWSPMRWAQMCGVTKKEVLASSPLLIVEGNDVIVWRYPASVQRGLEAKRNGGHNGGSRSAQARVKHSLQDSLPDASSIPSTIAPPIPSGIASTERNGTERKEETERNGSARESSRSLPEHLDTPRFREAWARWMDYLDQRNHGRAVPLQTLDAHLRELYPMSHADALAALQNATFRNLAFPALPFSKNSSAGPSTVSVPENAPAEIYTGGLKESL